MTTSSMDLEILSDIGDAFQVIVPSSSQDAGQTISAAETINNKRRALSMELVSLAERSLTSLESKIEEDPSICLTDFASTARGLDWRKWRARQGLRLEDSGALHTETIEGVFEQLEELDMLSTFNSIRAPNRRISHRTQMQGIIDIEATEATIEKTEQPEFQKWVDAAKTFPINVTAQVACGVEDSDTKRALTLFVFEAPVGNGRWIEDCEYDCIHDLSFPDPDMTGWLRSEHAKALGGEIPVFAQRTEGGWGTFGFYVDRTRYRDRDVRDSFKGFDGWRILRESSAYPVAQTSAPKSEAGDLPVE